MKTFLALVALLLGAASASAQVVTQQVSPGTPSLPGVVVNAQPSYVTGNWYAPWGYGVAGGAPAAPGVNKIVCSYALIGNAVTINAIGGNVLTNDAGKHFQFGIYSTGSWGRPSALVSSTADITLAGTGVVNSAVSSPLQPGGYWFCENTDSALAVLTAQSSVNNPIFQPAYIGSATQAPASSSGGNNAGISVAQTYGTWPASFLSSQTWTEVNTLICPILTFKVASSP